MAGSEKPAGPGRGGVVSFRWVFYALLAALLVGSLMMSQSGRIPDWEKCRESLFQQMFSDKCTPRSGHIPGNGGPSGGGATPGSPESGRNI